ncbi:beta-taxilin-like isoform X2 [Nerophis ophidion]|uniref:beta-taxilin-like isoform X2 n=1 Tax=Nerophis ophidion TaxID=159077 RepID=UPI002AE0302A|nr:beta-taxilin-like isoform X2 [Nerophis ophidion]
METTVETAELLAAPQPELTPMSDDAVTKGGAATPSDDCDAPSDPMEEFSRRLQEIISANAQAAEDTHDGDSCTVESEYSGVVASLSGGVWSPEEKLEHLMRKHAELLLCRRDDEKELQVLRNNVGVLQAERQQLEKLCTEVQHYYNTLREEALLRCKGDEEKRKEMTSHFQKVLCDIQAQIEQHSTRNSKLWGENANLSDKLHKLLEQCERRDESQQKINRHRDLQQQLTEAKLEQANALLVEAQEKHQREKEYLLHQAAEWKLQTRTLSEHAAITQAQLALYSQKFDEFQKTLAKSNEIYARFKQEMENMSEKMKTLEKESNVWKLRFENCNKALTDLIEERAEKGKEYETFVVTIHKLEKLCRVLQDERKVLYAKIKEVRQAKDDPSSKDMTLHPDEGGATVVTPEMALTEDMERLRAEQAKLQEFADALMASHGANREDKDEDLDPNQDLVASAFTLFSSKGQHQDHEQTSEETPPLPEPQGDLQTKPETDMDAKPEIETKPESEMKPETAGEPQSEPGVNIEAISEPQIIPESESKPEPEAVHNETPEVKVVTKTDNLKQTVEAEALPTSEATPPAARPSKKEAKKKKKKTGRNL